MTDMCQELSSKTLQFWLVGPSLAFGVGGGGGGGGGVSGGANDGHVSRTFIKTLQFGFSGPYHE